MPNHIILPLLAHHMVVTHRVRVRLLTGHLLMANLLTASLPMGNSMATAPSSRKVLTATNTASSRNMEDKELEDSMDTTDRHLVPHLATMELLAVTLAAPAVLVVIRAKAMLHMVVASLLMAANNNRTAIILLIERTEATAPREIRVQTLR